jgi:hypothetical protein
MDSRTTLPHERYKRTTLSHEGFKQDQDDRQAINELLQMPDVLPPTRDFLRSRLQEDKVYPESGAFDHTADLNDLIRSAKAGSSNTKQIWILGLFCALKGFHLNGVRLCGVAFVMDERECFFHDGVNDKIMEACIVVERQFKDKKRNFSTSKSAETKSPSFDDRMSELKFYLGCSPVDIDLSTPPQTWFQDSAAIMDSDLFYVYACRQALNIACKNSRSVSVLYANKMLQLYQPELHMACDRPRLLCLRAQSMCGTGGNPRKALLDLKEAEALSGSIRFAFHIGMAYLHCRQLTEASEYLKLFVKSPIHAKEKQRPNAFYTLVRIAVLQGRATKAKKYFRLAIAAEKLVGPVNSGPKMEAQMLISQVHVREPLSEAGGRECHYCGLVQETKLRACSACSAAVYCGRECQRNAWRNGHKEQCQVSETSGQSNEKKNKKKKKKKKS